MGVRKARLSDFEKGIIFTVYHWFRAFGKEELDELIRATVGSMKAFTRQLRGDVPRKPDAAALQKALPLNWNERPGEGISRKATPEDPELVSEVPCAHKVNARQYFSSALPFPPSLIIFSCLSRLAAECVRSPHRALRARGRGGVHEEHGGRARYANCAASEQAGGGGV